MYMPKKKKQNTIIEKKEKLVGDGNATCPKCGSAYKPDFGCSNKNCELYQVPETKPKEPEKPKENEVVEKDKPTVANNETIEKEANPKADSICPKCGGVYKFAVGCQKCGYVMDRDKPSGWAEGHDMDKFNPQMPPDMESIK